MSELEKHKELISMLAIELADRYKAISTLIPNENEQILKHLAAAAIHTTFFMRDFGNAIDNKNIWENLSEYEKKFLATCGCDE